MKTAIKYGIYQGVAMCLYTIFMWLTRLDSEYLATGQYLDIAVILIPLGFTLMAIRAKSKETKLTLFKRIGCGLIVNLVSFLIYTPFLIIYHHFVHPNWLKYALELKEKELLAKGLASDKISETVTNIAAQSNDVNLMVNGFIVGVLIFGVVFSVLSIPFIRSKTAIRNSEQGELC